MRKIKTVIMILFVIIYFASANFILDLMNIATFENRISSVIILVYGTIHLVNDLFKFNNWFNSKLK